MEFKKTRQGSLINDTHRECTSCGCLFEITSKMTICKKCNNDRVKSKSPEWKMHQRAKQRCKKSGLEFSISVADIVIPNICPILGIPLVVNSGRPGAYKDSPSLDRKDNSKGYIKGNVWVISQLANAMKHTATKEELKKFALWINSFVKDTE